MGRELLKEESSIKSPEEGRQTLKYPSDWEEL
ncbi:microviridin/marinostatin family tricyclic proteinase inhibitor [Microcystis aeruginosa]|nr:microviridin/marinostatin family tricyclic proteinase inhibitor [Microcystis aeruginosa LG13-11]